MTVGVPGQVPFWAALSASTLGYVNRLTVSNAGQLLPEVEGAQGVSNCNSVRTPERAQPILVLPQLESLLVIDCVVSRMMATLYCALFAPCMAAVAVVVIARD